MTRETTPKIEYTRCPVCGELSADRWMGTNMISATERFEGHEQDPENIWAMTDGKCGSPVCDRAFWGQF